MAYNRNLYSSDTDALDAGIIYDQNELMMQDEVNAAIKNGDLIVGQADNLASKMNQFSTGEFIVRTTGGDASLSDGDGHLVLIRGNMIHEGYIAESVDMTVTPIPRDPSAGEFTAQIDNGLFLAEMQDTSGTMVFTYGSSGWDYDPANYGITTDGLALSGDVISVTYQKEDRGTITQSNPSSFYSTGWNLYDHDLLRAKVVHYSDTYGFGIDGTYTQLLFSETLEGETEPITVTNGRFTIPSDGYVFVIGGNDTDTAIWMTWSDWQEGYVGEFKLFEESEISLEDIMTEYFPYGLMAVGSHQDEIDLSLGKATNNVARIAYTAENLDDVIEMGVEYDYDESYIYYGLTTPVINTIEIDNLYVACDHGIEYYTVTAVPIYTQTLYGVNLKNRLERDVVLKSGDTMTGQLNINGANLVVKNTEAKGGDTPESTSARHVAIIGSDGKNIAHMSGDVLRTEVGTNEYIGRTRARLTASNGSYTNTLQLIQDSNGARSINVSSPAAWRAGLGVVNIAGDTMTGTLTLKTNSTTKGREVLYIQDHEVKIGTNPSSNTYDSIIFKDADGTNTAFIRYGFVTDNRRMLQFSATAKNGSTTNYFNLGFDANGDPMVGIPSADKAAWRVGIGIGQSDGSFPLTIGQGGSGMSEIYSTSIKNDIFSSTGANCTIASQGYSTWGKIATITVGITTSAQLSSNAILATIANGKRPIRSVYCIDSSNGRTEIQANGDIIARHTISSGSTIYIYTSYMLS